MIKWQGKDELQKRQSKFNRIRPITRKSSKEDIPMKRFLFLTLALMLVACLVACNSEAPEAPH